MKVRMLQRCIGALFSIATSSILSLFVLFTVSGCKKSNSLDNAFVTLSLQPRWSMQNFDSAPHTDAILYIFKSDDGSLVEKRNYESCTLVKEDGFELESGKYKVLVLSNIGTSFIVSGESNLNDFLISLREQDEIPTEQAYFGVADVDTERPVYEHNILMGRILFEFTLQVNNVASDAVLSGKATCVANGIYPGRKSSADTYGVPTNTTAELSIPSVTAEGTTINAPMFLMPTASGQQYTSLKLNIADSSSEKNTFEINLSQMIGGEGTISGDYRAFLEDD